MRDPLSSFDLAVIGGGPAGTAAAINASRLGARVVLFEVGGFPRHKVCGEFISAESLDVFRDLLRNTDEAVSVLQSAPVTCELRLFRADQVVTAPIDPPALSIPRYHLDRLLWCAAQHAGVHARSNCEVRGITGEGPFAIDTASGTFHAIAVIVAAGRWNRFTPRTAAFDGPKWLGLKAHFRDREPASSTDLYFFELGYCGVQTVAFDVVNACAMVRSDRARTLAEVLALHPALAERANRWQPLMEPVCTAPLLYRLPEPVRGNRVFVGDAAAFIDPFVGDGISIALRTGCLAARELLGAVNQPDCLRSAVTSYGAKYEEQFAPLIRAAARIRKLLSCPPPLQSAAMLLFRLPGVLPYLIRTTRHPR